MKEHFVCHWLLTKMVDGKQRFQMENALFYLTKGKRNKMYEFTSIEFKRSRISSKLSKFGKPHPAKGKPSILKGRPSPMKGKTLSSTRKPNKNKGIPTGRSYTIGMRHSIEAKSKIGYASKGRNTNIKGRKWWTTGIDAILAKESPGEEWILGRGTYQHPNKGKSGKPSLLKGTKKQLPSLLKGKLGHHNNKGIANPRAGMACYNNGSEQQWSLVCPDGWVKGKLQSINKN